MMLAVKDRFSAKPDCGDLIKRRSVQPAGMSALNFFEPSLTPHKTELGLALKQTFNIYSRQIIEK
jgi:hypothetical protein